MRFVNMSARPAYSTMSGSLGPGDVSSDGGPHRTKMEKVLAEVVKSCGTRLGLRLNEREARLIDEIVTLDEKGRAFTKECLPEEIRNDPTGEKKREAMEDEAQRRKSESVRMDNEKRARTEAVINGETDEHEGRKSYGANEGPSNRKTGFDAIMEENARIASGEKKFDVNEILDPIAAHAKEPKEAEPAADEPAADEVPPPKADDAGEPGEKAPAKRGRGRGRAQKAK